ncbi:MULTISPECIES: SMI1/KNR4 family protein [Catenuloplanes]|uniref:Cell wall assembly regulator SMI1 n=1 Tax=Catenuloplanes niger TaxID=587534 RepID=A0AAE3ZZY4_9ACTN|nr:SMI1/KNR4 family protein [Catenuloplanes niger]MDR7328127.1 cell wall assembly regulator SMI1 [Catenuloplanes niger]
MSVHAAWERIERWMARHAPRSLALLAPPATPADIAALDAVLRFETPPALAESLRRHNGLTGRANLFPDAAPLSATSIAEHYETCMDVAEDVNGFDPDPETGEPWWDPWWVPFCADNGDALVVDLRPGPGHGRLGMARHAAGGDFTDGYPPLGPYLTAIADTLDHGGTVGSRHPYLTVDDELWWSLPGGTGLNGTPLRPAPRLR